MTLAFEDLDDLEKLIIYCRQNPRTLVQFFPTQLGIYILVADMTGAPFNIKDQMIKVENMTGMELIGQLMEYAIRPLHEENIDGSPNSDPNNDLPV